LKIAKTIQNTFYVTILMTFLTACGGGGGGSSSFESADAVSESSHLVSETSTHGVSTTQMTNGSANSADEGKEINDGMDAKPAESITPVKVEKPIHMAPAVEPRPESEETDEISADEEEKAEVESKPLVCERGTAIQTGRVRDNETGEPLAGVEVSIGGCVTRTDEDGFYTLKNIAENDHAVVNFRYDGYYEYSAVIMIKRYTTMEYAIGAIDTEKVIDSRVNNIIHVESDANIEINAGVITDGNGEVYNGKVMIKVAYGNPFNKRDRFAFPGLYEGENSNGETVLFSSYGYIYIALEDQRGHILGLADDMILTFPAVGGLQEENIPLWYYDYNRGVWVEEGYAVRQEDGTYKGMVSHAGMWSVNLPFEEAPGVYRAHMIYENGNPVKDARVSAIGSNWIQSDLSTDNDGVFEIKVIPDQEFGLSAYNYRYRYEAVYNDKISAIASGEVVEDRK